MTRPAQRTIRLLPWLLLALTLATMVAGMVLDRAAGSLDEGVAEGAALFAAFMAFPVVGALIAAREPGNAIGWMFIGIGLLVAVLVTGTAYARYGLVLHPERELPATTLGAWLEGWVWLPLIGTIPTLLFLLFPTGRPPSRRWKPVAWISGVYIALVTLLSMLEERLVSDGYNIPNPIGIPGLRDVEEMGALVLPFVPLALLCASSLFFRFRSARREERQQLKWVAVAAVLFAVGVIVGDTLELPEIIFPLLLGAIPVTVGIAILRYRLYDIDVIIKRTLVYAVLTGALVAMYLGLVVVLQRATAPFTSGSDLAVATSTLAVAAVFRPVRRRVQGFIDKSFYRANYDARQTLEVFSTHLRNEIDLDTVSNELLAAVGSTMRPAHAAVWLSGSER